MRKYLGIVIFYFIFASACFAQVGLFENESSLRPIMRGDILLDGGFSASYITEGADDTASKKQVYGGSVRMMYALSSRFYLGLEGIFDRGEMAGSPVPYGPEYGGTMAVVNVDENIYSVRSGYLVSRFNFNPASDKRFYLPLGVGYIYRKQTTTYKVEPAPGSAPPHLPGLYYSFDKSEKAGDGLSVYGGLGFEYDFSKHILGGLEARYFIFKSGGTLMQSASLLLKVGFRS